MLHWLENNAGMRIGISEWGAAWLSCQVPVGDGQLREVLLGTNNPEQMSKGGAYIGSLVGRYCGRIAEARFTLDEKVFTVDANEGEHHLHGGFTGLSRRRWQVVSQKAQELVLRTTSLNGDAGFPGNVNIQVAFLLENDNTVTITCHASTDCNTVLNLCNHAYFNLNGIGQPALTQTLAVEAEQYIPVDKFGLPTADAIAVANTPFDFRNPRPIAEGIYDHSFHLLDGRNLAATLESANGDLRLYISTTQPALHVYTGQGLAGEPDCDGNPYPACAGIALETQAPPDSANRHLDLVLTTPKQPYEHRTQYYFETE